MTEIQIPEFGPSEELTLAELRQGDFIEILHADLNLPAERPMSGIASVETDWSWERTDYMPGRRRGFRHNIAARRITLLSRQAISSPDSRKVTARRQIRAEG